MFKYWMAGFLFLSVGSSAMAQSATQGPSLVPGQMSAQVSVPPLDMTIPPTASSLAQHSIYPVPIQLASASTPPALESTPEIEEKSLFKPRLFTANNIHKYLGIGSMALATATIFVDKGDDDDEGGGESDGGDGGLHQTLGTGAAALGVAAVATGLTFHYDDLKYSNGLRDPDNLHALLGILGTLGYLYAVDTAGDGGHAGAGMLGAASMFYAIKLTW